MTVAVTAVNNVDVYALFGGNTYGSYTSVQSTSMPVSWSYTGTTYEKYLFLITKARQDGASLSISI
jgi:hypothetical protein